ncbi:PX domain-containing protein EREL1-like isoform X2 [Impatiens glandulifera]|nr:PX domain-containing protein EREL1-like isoform X2 [Impatiens glandulifera]
MMKLLSDIELSRSAPVASFLELEVAVRSSFQNENQQHTETSHVSGTSSSLQVYTNSIPTASAGPSSQTSDYGSDTAYETSGIESPILERDNNSEIGMDDLLLDDDLGNPIEKFVKYGMSNIDEGLFMGNSILEQIEGFPKHKSHFREINSVVGNVTNNGLESSGIDRGKLIGHSRKLSIESAGSDVSSPKSSELSNSSFQNSTGDGHLFNPIGPEISRIKGSQNHGNDLFESNSIELVLPTDQRQKMNRILVSMQRRLLTAKTDMEDLITRLNQEIAVKDYLDTKVKDLEVELETTRQKSKESLQHAILVERERVTQMQWDMEELRQKSFELELKLKSQQGDGLDKESTNGSVLMQDMETTFFAQEKDDLLQELGNTKKQLQDLLKRHEELQMKSKADIKVLVREVKSLRSSQIELKQEVSQSLKEKSDTQDLLQLEKQKKVQINIDRKKLLNECSVLHTRLMECTRHIRPEHGEKLVMDSDCIPDALNLLELSDNQISCLLEEVESLAESDVSVKGGDQEDIIDEETRTIDKELKKMLANILMDNAKLRKETNSALRSALGRDKNNNGVGADPTEIVQNNVK